LENAMQQLETAKAVIDKVGKERIQRMFNTFSGNIKN
jgi:hypothetical protein